MDLNKEYYISPYYFYLKDKGNEISLYFSSEETITEARKKDVMMKIPKDKVDVIKKYLKKCSEKKEKKSTEDMKGEIEELIDFDGNMNNSKIPILNKQLSPIGTTDQKVVTGHQPSNPVTRGYRVYYGESTEGKDDVVKEVDFSDAFGFEETKDLDGKKTFKYLVKKMDMEPDEAIKRTKQFGKNPFKSKESKNPKVIDKMTLKEMEKNKLSKMVEVILNKKNNDTEIVEKDKGISKFLIKNLKSIKKLADKEGISLSQLIKALKNEQ